MTEVVTYYSANAKPKERWLAYAILPDGNQWQVRFTGETEEVAKSKAIRLYEAELAKYAGGEHKPVEQKPSDGWSAGANPWPVSQGRGAHFAGKAWLIHKETRQKIRVPVEQVEQYLGEYERGGPRSK